MAQVCDGYTPNCLMGNWYEEKLAPQQHLRTSNAFQPVGCYEMQVHQLDPNISFADSFGNLLPLERMRRAQPWNTNGLVQDCAKKEPGITMTNHVHNKLNVDMQHAPVDHRSLTKKYQNSSHALTYPESNPFHLQVRSSQALKMFSGSNQSELRVNRPADTQTFRSTLKPACSKGDKMLAQTTYSAFFDQKRLPQLEGQYVVQRPMVGQKFAQSKQPKQNTAVQRSWLQSSDLGLEWCRRSKIPAGEVGPPTPQPTNQPSFRRQRSQITLQENKLFCFR